MRVSCLRMEVTAWWVDRYLEFKTFSKAGSQRMMEGLVGS